MNQTETAPDLIREELFRLQDLKFRDFQRKLIPNLNPETIIGIRTPTLRSYAKQLLKSDRACAFLEDLPHRYFDENQLHAFLLSELKSYERCIVEVNRFLPYVDNWATCDQLSPKSFQNRRRELLPQIRQWICSEEPYPIRFGVGMLMQHFLDDAFDPKYLELVASIRSEEYYVNMMIAWYFATALAKQYESALPFLEQQRLDIWTHNKTVQKAAESYRIAPERKPYLKSLKKK